jgi:histidinol-phosphate aminotransferase
MRSVISPNEHLLGVYRVAEHMDERAGYVRLDRNERVEPLSQDLFQQLMSAFRPSQLCAYPDPSPLLERLTRSTGLATEWLYPTPGSDASIRMVLQAFLAPGDVIVIPDPTYAMYEIYARMHQAHARKVPYDERLQLDFGHLLAQLDAHPRVLALPNPDQPSGTVVSTASLETLLARACETGTLVVIDEAYFPYWPESAIAYVREFENLVVTRTLSKAFGLAGLRVGFFAANPRIVDYVQRVRGAHEVNAAAIAAATWMLDHPQVVTSHLADVAAGKAVLADAAAKLGLEFPECHTNFQLLGFPGRTETSSLVEALREEGYLVKGAFSQPGFRDKIRVTLASPAIMSGFADALTRIVGK